MRFGGPNSGGGGLFGGAPDIGWRYVSVAQATATQSTLLSTTFSDQPNNEIQCAVASGANNAGAIDSAGYMLIPIFDNRGRALNTAANMFFEVEVIPVTAPANGTYPYFVAGITSKTSTANFNSIPVYATAGVNYQPAANPRGYYLLRNNGLALTPLTIGSGSAIGNTGGRVYASGAVIYSTLFLSGMSSTIFNAANTALTGATLNNVFDLDINATDLRLIVAAGSLGGALVANTTIGCKVRYRVTRLTENA